MKKAICSQKKPKLSTMSNSKSQRSTLLRFFQWSNRNSTKLYSKSKLFAIIPDDFFKLVSKIAKNPLKRDHKSFLYVNISQKP